jgi:hypothetical protein
MIDNTLTAYRRFAPDWTQDDFQGCMRKNGITLGPHVGLVPDGGKTTLRL